MPLTTLIAAGARRRSLAVAGALATLALGGCGGTAKAPSGQASGEAGADAAASRERGCPRPEPFRPRRAIEVRHGTAGGCEIRFAADLPPGWHEGSARLTVFAEGTLGGLGGVVTFANFRPPPSPFLPIPGMTREDVAVSIFDSAPATRAEEADAPVPAVAAADFHQRSNSRRGDAVATAELLSAGQAFQVWVEVGRGPPQPRLVAEANAVLASLRTDEHLCPCR